MDKNYFQQKAEEITAKMTTEEQAEQLKYDAPANEKAGLKAYNWWSEALHGVARAGSATMFPQAIGLAAMFDDKFLEEVADVISTEARAMYNAYSGHEDRDIYKGLTLWSPNINIFRDPRWGRGQETYGEDPFLTGKLGSAFVRGLQGKGEFLKTAACAKHLAVHSGPENLRHEFDAVASPKDMEETYLPAFRELIEDAGVEGVMGAYNRVNGEPACASKFLMGKLKEWNFDGYFVSDCWAIRDFHTSHKVTSTAPESAAMALKAGCDINCGNTYLHILEALEEGLIEPEDIRKACVHAMRTRARLGMFEEGTEFDSIPYDVVGCKKHKKVALECSRRSMVLLKNNGILPLAKSSLKSIAVIGPNADSREALEGNYCGRADEYVTFLEGIRNAFDGRIFYSEGSALFKDRVMNLAVADDRLAEAVIAAENSDVVILCVGLNATLEGEEGDTGNEFCSGDKPDLRLPETQRKLIKAVLGTGKPVIIVNATGSAINIEEEPDALIHAWYPGQFGGTALADILFGNVSPSGKLPVTFYEDASKLPEFTDYSMKNRTYRYAEGNVLYPFGYGLTYSKTKVSDLSFADGTATVTVENTGNFDTGEIVQFYIKDTSADAVPNHSLCGFARVDLKKGEKKTVSVKIEDRSFTAVHEDGTRSLDGKEFTLYAGISQPDELSRKLTGTETVSVKINK
ncbi:glycoside hydrolase family 3 C-terminal domain-containing protein [Ruminococcus sp. HUN007]|uniref:glycoside hydrolase family 3 C-terminal domain-containing protein n=1 Tax=Ruminococcus sp. HUN007 TaxID=1514668 RepID=UPI0005D15C68|nr:glycoside hydrolase family 3 C-terminal domain-containing protein [Ruminococcus sp. HUN007]